MRLAQTYDWIWAAVGSHPDDADHVDAARIEVYRALCKSPRVQAIGEIGLDYHYEDVSREVQKHALPAADAAGARVFPFRLWSMSARRTRTG